VAKSLLDLDSNSFMALSNSELFVRVKFQESKVFTLERVVDCFQVLLVIYKLYICFLACSSS